MEFRLIINLDNALFQDQSWQYEVARILSDEGQMQMYKLPRNPECTVTLKLRDNNGNTVGHVSVSPDTEGPDDLLNDCPGHESTDGPIGNTIYCDGSCQSWRMTR
jgi:hypothetical protein